MIYRENCKVLDQQKVAPGHYILTLHSQRIAKAARAGQFAQILCDGSSDPLLPRPFSFLTAAKNNFSILYHTVGKGTTILSKAKKGDKLWVIGPCGNGFDSAGAKKKKENDKQFLLVGGGVGIPPLYHFAWQLLKEKYARQNIHVFLGARDKSLLLCEKEFKKLGIKLHLATDNGSRAHKGFVTELLEDFLCSKETGEMSSSRRRGSGFETDSRLRGNDNFVYTCGPTPMMKAVSVIAQKYETPCQVSVEVPMACGFGACMGCAVKVKHENDYRYALACKEGPVFGGAEIVWE